jgi:putative zincin peptidase
VSFSPQSNMPDTSEISNSPDTLSAPSGLRLVSLLLRGHGRRRVVAALRSGNLRTIAQTDLLAPARLPSLARDSLTLLVAGGAFFAIVNILAWDIHGVAALPGPDSTFVRLFLLVVANLVAYSIMLPLHEAVHALTILLLGGRPRFGLRLPLAAYCTAPGQVFTRRGYIVVALAPLVVLTVVGVVITALWPQWATWLWFGFAGNISGAVGDLATASEVRRLPSGALIVDDETGYIAYMAGDAE